MPDGERRGRRIRSRSYGLPYSKGRMAQTLMVAGFDPERAYQLAQRIEAEVDESPDEELSLEQLHSVVEAVLEREAPPMADRYRRWRHVTQLQRPLVVLIGGATGTGKSTLATEVAYRLGISRISSSDVVRQVMRALFAHELMPALHYSSFEAGDGLKTPMPDPDAEDRALYGFIQQAEQVAVGVNAVLGRAVFERLSTVVEGIHVVPGLVGAEAGAGAVVAQVLLAVEDEETHQSHFFVRGFDAEHRPMDRYLRRFGEIRRIQDYLVARADRLGVPVIEAGDPDRALLSILDLVLERATAGVEPVR